MMELARFLIVLVVGAVLMVVAFWFGPTEAQEVGPLARQQTNIDYERTFLSIAGTLVLLIPTYWAFILQHRAGASRLWRSLWTVTWLTFVVHLFWAIRVVMSFSPDGLPPATGTRVDI